MIRRVLIVTAAAVVAIVAFVAGALLHTDSDEESQAPANVPSTNTGTASPDHGATHTGPVEGADLARAQRLFAANCASCHLGSGKGDPHHRKDGIPDFTDAAWHAKETDAELISSVENGRGKVMPVFKDKLTLEEITLLVHYLRDMPTRAGAPGAARQSATTPPAEPSNPGARAPKTTAEPKPASKPDQDHSGHGNHQ